MNENSILTVIPARGGSKGLPRKNITLLAGLPLIEHSIRFAQMCPEITRLIVSTDDDEIAEVARAAGVEVPFIRPAALASDETPIMPVLRHALEVLDPKLETYRYVMLLEPTSVGRVPEDVTSAFEKLESAPAADGVVTVHEPELNILWLSVVERQGVMEDLFDEAKLLHRRQDTPQVFQLNAALLIWRSEFVAREDVDQWRLGSHVVHQIPESQVVHIDDARDLSRAEALLAHGLVHFPWLSQAQR